ncbi:MAG TPA: hypothetical protein VGP64_00600 [Polyangia bacterium]|jgi:hypothetical protein
MRAHLPGCSACREHYDRHLALARLDPCAPSPEERLARGLGLAAGRRPVVGWRLAGLAAAGAVAAAVMMLPRIGHERDLGFATRGGAGAGRPELLVYRVPTPTSAPRPAGEVMAPTDELAFAYRNPIGKRRLMIFGVDEHRHVYWYHPAWSRAEENPTGIPISGAPGTHELPDAVTQPLDGENLSIHALFSDQALTVRQIEQAVAQRGSGGGNRDGLAVPGAVDLVRTLRVAPR